MGRLASLRGDGLVHTSALTPAGVLPVCKHALMDVTARCTWQLPGANEFGFFLGGGGLRHPPSATSQLFSKVPSLFSFSGSTAGGTVFITSVNALGGATQTGLTFSDIPGFDYKTGLF